MAWRPVSKAAERRYALFLEWYRKELASRRPDLEPTASLSKAMFASYYHCEKAVKEDKIFERLDVVLRGILSYRSKKYIPTLPGLIKLKQATISNKDPKAIIIITSGSLVLLIIPAMSLPFNLKSSKGKR